MLLFAPVPPIKQPLYTEEPIQGANNGGKNKKKKGMRVVQIQFADIALCWFAKRSL